jgi:SAM-dependent methyltransferase
MPSSWFFEPAESWTEWERSNLDTVGGPVLDLGAGAGRVSLYLQGRGLEVTAVDNSPGAIEVCKQRGVADARLQDFGDELPNDKSWQTVLLLCGNFGLAGSWEGTRLMLSQLHDNCADGAVILADTFDPTLMADTDVQDYQKRMIAEGEYVGNVTLRFLYGEIESPWWGLTNVLIEDVPRIIEGTGWLLEDHHISGMDHYLKLRRE